MVLEGVWNCANVIRAGAPEIPIMSDVICVFSVCGMVQTWTVLMFLVIMYSHLVQTSEYSIEIDYHLPVINIW